MKLKEYSFHDYYRSFFVLEMDTLTERFSDVISLQEKDCFALCSSYINENGLLQIPVLAVGSSFEKTTKGLRKKEMLSEFDFAELEECEVRFVSPSLEALRKQTSYFLKKEEKVSEDLLETRKEERIDHLRDMDYPDIVQVDVLKGNRLYTHDMQIVQFFGPFIEGVWVNEDEKREMVRALPYFLSNEFRLLCVFVGENYSTNEKRVFNQILSFGSEYGFGFDHPLKKN